jgi:hypothetical protein
MQSKEIYESLADIAEALPYGKREEFAELVADLARPRVDNEGANAVAARRWLRDSGWRT